MRTWRARAAVALAAVAVIGWPAQCHARAAHTRAPAPLEVPSLPGLTVQPEAASRLAATAALSSGLRRCLKAANIGTVDGSRPAALAQAAGGQLWSTLHSSQVPLAVVYPRTAAAVAAAVRCARTAGFKVTARSGGGSFQGYSVRKGTLTVDLSRLNTVLVSPERSVTAQGGVRLGQLYYEVWQQAGDGVAAVGGTCPNVGVGGHILGGGFGYLTPAYGLACDQLLSITMADASGNLVTANSTHNQRLFAASCGGGGGNFGIVTEYRLRLHPQPTAFTFGRFQIAARDAVDFMMWWQSKLLPKANGKLYCELKLEGEGITGTAFFPGRRAALNAELRRVGLLGSRWLPAAALPPAATSEMRRWIDVVVVTAGSKVRNSTPEALLDFDYMLANRPMFAEKSWFGLKPLPRSAFKPIFDVLHRTGAHIIAQSLGLKTAVRRRKPSETAFPWRNALFYFKAAKRIRDKGEADELASDLKAVQKVVAPYFPGQPAYINYVDDQASKDPLKSYYGSNLDWLRKVKRQYDPDDYFNTNPVAIPAAAAAGR